MHRLPSQAATQRVSLLFSVLFGLALLAGTLRPGADLPQSGSGLCLICGEVGGADFVANIVAFVPFGLALRGALKSTGRAAIIALAFTLIIELLQWRVIPGRDASIGDVVANALGGGAGALIAGHWRSLVLPDRGQALRWILAWCVICISALATVSWLLMPSPVIYRFWSYWAPLQRGHQPFPGTVRSVSLFGTTIPNHAKVEPSSMPDAYRSGAVDLTLSIAPPYPAGARAEVFRLSNPLSQRANVAVVGRDIAFQPPLNAARWRFWLPSVRFSNVLDDNPDGASMHFLSGRGEVTLRIRNGRQAPQIRRNVLGPVDSWKFVLSDQIVPRALHPLLAALWFSVVFVPLGFWSGSMSRALPGILAATAVAAVGFLAGPLVARLPAASVVHWFGALTCTLVGWAAGRILGRSGWPNARLNQNPINAEVDPWKP